MADDHNPGPIQPCCSSDDWSVIEIAVTNQWITNQAGTDKATDWAKSSTEATITVQNDGQDTQVIGNKWINITLVNDKGEVVSDGLHSNLDLVITDSNGVKTVIKGATSDFKYTLEAGDEEGMVNLVAKYDGSEHIISTLRVFGIPILTADYWTCWDDFCKYFCNVFGVDNTSPIVITSVIGHAVSSSEWGGAKYWTTVNYEAFDNLSGVKSITETSKPGSGHNHPVIHTITVIDNAGNKTVKEVITNTSYAFASIALCEKCWHSMVNDGDMSGTGNFHVFAPGGWVYYKCPYCGYSSEDFMRNAYKEFVAHGGYVPAGDLYKGTGYDP